MENLKLSIELIPKGAWGNNLRTTLPKKDWDTLRELCYKKAQNICDICGYKSDELDAHEVWDFDMQTKTQTLKDIIALCSKCHGVKHMRNSERLGYGENARRHFLKINKCDEMTMANHIFQTQMLFEERNEIYRWRLDVASLYKFGGKGMGIKERNIPLIESPYKGVDYNKLTYKELEKLFPSSKPKDFFGPPLVKSVEVDNYQGVIKLICIFTDKIDWSLDGELIKTKYNVIGKFNTEIKVQDLKGSELRFRLTGDGGTTYSQIFKLIHDKNHKEVL